MAGAIYSSVTAASLVTLFDTLVYAKEKKSVEVDKHYEMGSLEAITAYSRSFALERGWENFQNPKNIVMALSVECAELLEHFQWLDADASAAIDADKKLEVGDEIADVLFYLVRLADILAIDIPLAAARKAQMNAIKYPLTEVSD